jgi:hypothetical protein
MAVEVHKCGAPLDPLDTMRFISELDVTGLVELFEGKLDRAMCKGCGEPIDVRPTVVVGTYEPMERLSVLGSRHGAPQRHAILAVAQREGASLAEFASLDELRAAVGRRLGSSLARIIHG